MGFWNKLGKIALTAAPYVAAPFTGGASLAFAPMAKQGVQAWNESDARKNAAKGLGPSNFDRYIGLAGDVAGMASSVGAMGKFGAGKYDDGTGAGSSWQDKLGNIVNGGQSPYRTPPFVGNSAAPQSGRARFGGAYAGNSADSGGDTSYINDAISGVAKSGQGKGGGVSGFIDKLGGAKGIAGIAGGIGGAYAIKKVLDKKKENAADKEIEGRNYNPNPEPREVGVDDPGVSRFQSRMRRELGPIMGQTNQNNPNLALSIGQGRMDAMRDQPFRGGYDVKREVDYDEDTGESTYEYNEMPRIGPGKRRRNDRYYGQREEAAQ